MSQQAEQSPLKKTQVFDQARVRRAFDNAAENYEQFAVLQNEVCKRLLEKLEIVKISPEFILDAGSGTGSAIPTLFERYKKAQIVALDLSENMLNKSGEHGGFFRSPHLVCADIEHLPFADHSFDLVYSSLSMQWCNDLNAVLMQARRVLKPGGLFVFTTFGPDTLKELRHSWGKIDDVNHVNQFVDMHDIGDALLLDGFAEPVMEAEIMTVTYDSVDEIMHDLKAIGANVTAESARDKQKVRGLAAKSILHTVRHAYEQFRQDGLLPATYEIIYGHAWKPELDTTKDSADRTQHVEFER